MTFTFSPLPMEAAKKFWADKVVLTPGQFNALSDEARLRGFAVGGISKADQLSSIFSAIQRAIDDGISFGEFKKETREIWKKKGWTGRKAWRVDNIFRTNVQTAYGVGRYRQMAETAKRRPYWQYDAVNDSRTRPTHAALDGRVFPAEHAFWDKWYPPNGFRCRCSVRSMTAAQVKTKGLTVETEDPTGGLIEPVDPRSGVRMPARPLMPDRGFDIHPGKSVYGGIVNGRLAEGKKLAQMPDLRGAADYRLPAARNLKHLPEAPELLPSISELKADGKSNREASRYYLAEFRKAFGLPARGAFAFDVNGEPVIVSERMVTGRGGRIKITKGDRGQYIPLFKSALLSPDEIWLTPMKDDAGKVVLRRRHLKYWRGRDENIAGFGVMEIEGGVWNGISIYDVQAGQAGGAGENLLDGPDGYRRGLLLQNRGKR